jgi:hypothetical protein
MKKKKQGSGETRPAKLNAFENGTKQCNRKKKKQRQSSETRPLYKPETLTKP